MDHCAKDGTPKIVNKCSLPLTGTKVVNMIISNLGVFSVDRGIKLLEFATGVDANQITESTEAEVEFPKIDS